MILTVLRHSGSGTSPSVVGQPAYPESPTTRSMHATGRGAILHIAQRLHQLGVVRALVPAFAPEGLIAPLRHAGLATAFYRLTIDLRPDLDSVDHLLATSGERAAVAVIHYFGFPKVSPALRRLCEGHGAILIEDFAQAPFSRDASDRPLSDEAPLSVFSLNKFLPVTEGAAAFSNASEVSLQIFEDSRGAFPPDATSSYNEHLRAVARLVESTSDDPGFLTSAMTSIGDTYESYYRHIHPGVTDWRSSDCVGGNLIPSFDYTSMVSRRRMNAELLYASIAWDNWHLGEPTLTSGVVPFAIPILVPREDRDSIVRSLLGSGVWLAVLQEKWNFIPAGRESEFPIETEWLQSHVLAPVGEWIPADRIQDMGLALNRAAADRASRKVRRDVH